MFGRRRNVAQSKQHITKYQLVFTEIVFLPAGACWILQNYVVKKYFFRNTGKSLPKQVKMQKLNAKPSHYIWLAAPFHCNNTLADRRQNSWSWNTYWKNILTQAAVAEVLSQADISQLARCDLPDLKGHSGALTHRLHPYAHRLHLQHKHRHLLARSTQRTTSGSFWSVTTDRRVATRDLLPCLLQGRLCSETQHWPCRGTRLPPAPVLRRPRRHSRQRSARWWRP